MKQIANMSDRQLISAIRDKSLAEVKLDLSKANHRDRSRLVELHAAQMAEKYPNQGYERAMAVVRRLKSELPKWN